MEVVIVSRPDAVGKVGGERVAAALTHRRRPVLGVATGSSPLAIYDELSRRVASGDLDLRRVRGFALDEYVGLSPSDKRSYSWSVRNEIETPLGLRRGAIRVPDGMAPDLERAALAFERSIRRLGGVDLQIVGVGSNGHLGFNEPSSSMASRTRVVLLAAATRRDNARFFAGIDEVPTHSVTQGLGTILDARAVLMVAAGEGKSRAVAAAIEGPVTSSWPCSALQLHPNVVVVLDEAAACRLRLRDYYRAALR